MGLRTIIIGEIPSATARARQPVKCCGTAQMSKPSHLRPPGPPPRFLIGNFPLASPDPLAIFTRWASEFGDMFYYRAGWVHVYFLNHPDLIESALVTQQQN